MKYLMIPILPLTATAVINYIPGRCPMILGCTIAGIVSFLAAFFSLSLLYQLMFSAKPRLW